jgi:hypothetical protein
MKTGLRGSRRIGRHSFDSTAGHCKPRRTRRQRDERYGGAGSIVCLPRNSAHVKLASVSNLKRHDAPDHQSKGAA